MKEDIAEKIREGLGTSKKISEALDLPQVEIIQALIEMEISGIIKKDMCGFYIMTEEIFLPESSIPLEHRYPDKITRIKKKKVLVYKQRKDTKVSRLRRKLKSGERSRKKLIKASGFDNANLSVAISILKGRGLFEGELEE